MGELAERGFLRVAAAYGAPMGAEVDLLRRTEIVDERRHAVRGHGHGAGHRKQRMWRRRGVCRGGGADVSAEMHMGKRHDTTRPQHTIYVHTTKDNFVATDAQPTSNGEVPPSPPRGEHNRIGNASKGRLGTQPMRQCSRPRFRHPSGRIIEQQSVRTYIHTCVYVYAYVYVYMYV